MKTLALALTAFATLAVADTASAAACRTRYLSGMWVGTANSGDDSYCIVQFNSRGWIVQARCFDASNLRPGSTFDGRFTTTRACAVTGTYDVIPRRGSSQRARFTGTFDAEAGIMRGRLRVGSSRAENYTFRQQW